MRDYLYIWNDPVNRFIVASGIEFRDLADRVGSDGGLVLLESGAGFFGDYIEQDKLTEFVYVPRSSIPELAKQDIYSWGNFCWVDYRGESFPALPDQEIAELLFFNHMAKPLDRLALPSLGNKHLCDIHDDGWYLKLFYSSWDDIIALIGARYPQLNLSELRTGKIAYWLSGESVDTEELSMDIDAILNRRL
ncbi:MAG: hypothetical protein ABFD54_03840 [Armatimonadota bacterium]|nr:hypothetical protein [bacterium]